jgi:tRNA G18 (ribose-2'-O)-methylase SpoU
MVNTRGYFGIGIYQPKTIENVGTLWRSAYQMGAAFIFVIGARYKNSIKASDTYKAYRHIPLFEYKTFDEFQEARPYGAQLVGIEFNDASVPLETFKHPATAIYILGSEDTGLPKHVVAKCQHVVELPAVRQPSYNVAVAGSLVMYSRMFIKNP